MHGNVFRQDTVAATCGRTGLRIAVALAWLLSVGPVGAGDVIEEAQAQIIPWSGYWWPHAQGALLGPLRKYDTLNGGGAAAADWEQKAHPPGDEVASWHGYCHAWAASAVMESEPRCRHDAGQPPRHVELLVGDQKGLLAVCHTLDDANSYRERDGAIVMGSGRWVGPSREDHPDFAWYPFVARGENPEVDYAVVKQLIGIPADQPAPTPAPEPQPQPESPPQPVPAPEPSPSADFDNPPVPMAATEVDGKPRVRCTVISPWELVALIARKTSDFGLDVTVDRFDGGLYEVGDTLRVRVTSERAGYVYLLYVDSQGTVSLLYPQPGDDNRLGANQERYVPAQAEQAEIRVAPPLGTARIKAIVCARPLGLSGLQPAVQSQVTLPASASTATGPVEERPSAAGLVTYFQGFRWHPTQQALIRQMMLRYQQHSQLAPDQYGRIDPGKVLGRFAQDEVAFYIGPQKGA